MGVGRRTWGRELGDDAGLVDHGLQVVEHGGGVPDVVALAQQGQLLLALVAQAPPVLLEALELVDELVHHVPQPAVG